MLSDLRAMAGVAPGVAADGRPVDAKLAKNELAAWTMLTNQLFNLDEVLNK